MRILKKILFSFLVVVAFFSIVVLLLIFNLKPDYHGTKELPNLGAEVKVYYDSYGIPHIYSENERDAFRALGYVHAQDRLWQMELLRRIATGRLSEVFGKDLLATDKLFLSLGIDEHTKVTVANLDRDSKMVQLTEAYLDGVNAFVEKGPKPVEFYLTGIESEPFTLEDVYNTIGYMAFSFAMAHKTDPLLTRMRQQLGEEYLKDLPIDSDTSTVFIKNYKRNIADSISANMMSAVEKALKILPIPQFEGSNSWVIAPEKTKEGKVIFANDPHIGFSQPAVWYEAHIVTPTFEKYGYHLGGVPFPLLGHDRNLAYGLTMFENDDIDFYFEETNPSNKTEYKTEYGWEAYETITKTIKIKDDEDVSFSFKKSRHGPLLNGIADQILEDRPVAMSWLYTKLENEVMHGLYGMVQATNIKDFREALPNIHAPGLNVMYGDARGNVAWWATAKLYKMPDSVSTKFVLDGTTGKEEPLHFLDFSENPQAINPPWNYVYSANNQPDSIAGMLYPGYYLPENRAKRIEQLLAPKNDWDQQAVSKMILDVTSPVNTEVITGVIKSIDAAQFTEQQIEMIDLVNSWKGDYPLNSVAATFYHRCAFYVLKNVFEDELGPEQFRQFMDTHLLKREIAFGVKLHDSKWWDDVTTDDLVETQREILGKSVKEAWQSLVEDFGADYKKWTWDKVHTLEHGHPIGQIDALRSFFNVGPFPVIGSREVINNMSFPYDSTGFYHVGSGPSTRRVIDFSDVENSISILPTGQSGNPFSSHYRDQAEMYINGEFRKMMMNKEEIINSSESLLVLKPKN
ncbi:penicillin acylase family protein [Pareuzebyella sediminis]|uniref:penicillin acylase family protein n=1 Tax=Pareuzebyella sediminis TaxID=2607998 RepID=UPI0011EBF4A6|nr:penicillin acylase family protein [Pareuzebyella sediminis]